MESVSENGRATIPQVGFVRLSQILKVIPLGKTTWWEGVKSGRFPKPVKLSEHCTAWRAEDIHALIWKLSEPLADQVGES